MAAYSDTGALSARDLNGGIPPDPAAVLTLHRFIAGEVGFLVNGDRVDVGRGVFLRQLHIAFASLVHHVQQDVACARSAFFIDQAGERVDPFLGFVRIVVRNLTEQSVDDGMLLVCAHRYPFLSRADRPVGRQCPGGSILTRKSQICDFFRA